MNGLFLALIYRAYYTDISDCFEGTSGLAHTEPISPRCYGDIHHRFMVDMHSCMGQINAENQVKHLLQTMPLQRTKLMMNYSSNLPFRSESTLYA